MHSLSDDNNPTNIYLFKVNNRNTIKRCEICSKLTIKTPERLDVALVFLLLTLNIFHTLSTVSIVYLEEVNVSWVPISVTVVVKGNYAKTEKLLLIFCPRLLVNFHCDCSFVNFSFPLMKKSAAVAWRYLWKVLKNFVKLQENTSDRND